MILNYLGVTIYNLVSGCCFPMKRLANGTKFRTFRSKRKITVPIDVQAKFPSFLAWCWAPLIGFDMFVLVANSSKNTFHAGLVEST